MKLAKLSTHADFLLSIFSRQRESYYVPYRMQYSSNFYRCILCYTKSTVVFILYNFFCVYSAIQSKL